MQQCSHLNRFLPNHELGQAFGGYEHRIPRLEQNQDRYTYRTVVGGIHNFSSEVTAMATMGRAYSDDLRVRILEPDERGEGSCRVLAERLASVGNMCASCPSNERRPIGPYPARRVPPAHPHDRSEKVRLP
jgi:hypothetical protein